MAETALAEKKTEWPDEVYAPTKYDGRSTVPPKLVKRALAMRANGCEIKEISVATGITIRKVRGILQRYSAVFSRLNETQEYTAVKGKILDAAELAVLEQCVDTQKLEKADLKSCGYVFKVLHDANRLHKGLSTSNVSQQVSVQLKPLTELQQSLLKK